MTPFDTSGKEAFENIVQTISPFPTMFSTLSKTEIFVTFNLSSANAFNLDQSKILSSGNGLTYSQTTNFETLPN